MRELIDAAEKLLAAGEQPSPAEAKELREAVGRLTERTMTDSDEQDPDKLDNGFILDESKLG